MIEIAGPPAAIAREQEVARYLERGDIESAQTLCLSLTAEFPHFAPGWHRASVVALRLGDPQRALVLIDRALASAPSDARYLLQRAHSLRALCRIREALECAAQGERMAWNDAPLLDALGTFYSLVGEHQHGHAAYSRAIAIDPARSQYWFNRAAVRRFLGQIEEAEADYDRSIALDPDDYEAYINRSELRTQGCERNHIGELRRLLAYGIRDWHGEVQLRYALAKELEDVGEYARSWHELAQGARLRRDHLKYDVARDVATVGWIVDEFPAMPAQPIGGCPSAEPIFIIGLPRSGSTLVERILASHSGVFPAGEMNHFAAAVVDAVRFKNPRAPLPRQALIAASRELDFKLLGADYLARAHAGAALCLAHFTDKMPLNYLYCGLIRRALPAATIIHVTRHPMAACYAIFKTLFKDGYPFSYDLGDLAQYYIGYRRLMDHWRSIMPGAIYELRYERLVTDQTSETRRLLEACGLEWEEKCLQFHRNPAATTTASAAQVRRPLYASSINQWHHYAGELQGLRSQLVTAGIPAAELE